MMKYGLVLLVALMTSVSAFAGPVDFCGRYANNSVVDGLLKSLAEKLQYSFEGFCSSERIMDVHQEKRRVYHRETDTYQPYIFITIHYSENSCEYGFNLQQNLWLKQHCYNTF